jgi:hypothetical protein
VSYGIGDFRTAESAKGNIFLYWATAYAEASQKLFCPPVQDLLEAQTAEVAADMVSGGLPDIVAEAFIGGVAGVGVVVAGGARGEVQGLALQLQKPAGR